MGTSPHPSEAAWPAQVNHYDADACCPDGFTPTLDYVDLQDGETAEGWLLFDVPARHGEVVLKQSYGGGKIATWRF